MSHSLSFVTRAFVLGALLVLASPASAQTPPASFQSTVSYSGTSHSVNFELHSARGPNFGVEVQQAGGAFAAHTPGPIRTYLGTIASLPGAMASALRRSDGSIYYHVLFEDGAEWINNGGGTTLRTHANWTPNFPSLVTGSGGAGSNIWAAEVGVDIPFSQYSLDGDVAVALEMVEHSVNTVNLLYLRDAGVLHRLGRVVMRADAATDPYFGMTTTGALLGEIPNQWNNVLPPSTHDLALVATSATGGGLASVGVIGNPGYSANGATTEGDFTVVWRHEAGHNWSLSHFDGGTPEGKTINSGNSLSRMSGSEQAKAVQHRIARAAFLDNLGSYGDAIPPRASLDRESYPPQSSGVAIDVLDNDHDANGEALSILSFEGFTALGGTVALSPGTGPGGRDELLYTPPPVATSQSDHFSYRIADTSGREGVGNVMTKLTSESDLLAHFTMDAGSGSVSFDSTAYLRHAELDGGPFWDMGVIGGGITFDGVDDRLLANALDTPTANFSVTGWVKRDGPQNSWAGIAFSRGGSTASGLNFGIGDELRYHWNGGQWQWNSGLVVPDNTWTFVALVVSPGSATVYMDSGSGLQSATNFATHNIEAFDAGLTLGRDPHSGGRTLKGTLDDLRIYARSLSSAEIAAAANGLGSASNPSPEHLASSTASNLMLAWTASSASTNQRIYFSKVYSDVRDGLASADQGLEASSTWMTPCLTNGSWFWRVDTTDGAQWAEGPVWSFTTSGQPGGACFPNSCMGGGGDQLGCTDCPCSNNALPGSGGGCLNSGGFGSRLLVAGDPSVSLPSSSPKDLRFSVTEGPPLQLFILNSGEALAPNNPANPCFGLDSGIAGALFDGLRCVIVNTQRNGGRGADFEGQVGFGNQPWGGEGNPPGGIAQFFGYTAGTTQFFQCVHRDSPSVNCGTGLNTTQAIEVVFTP